MKNMPSNVNNSTDLSFRPTREFLFNFLGIFTVGNGLSLDLTFVAFQSLNL